MSFFCEGIFHMGRDFVELHSGNEAVSFQLPQRCGQHGIGDAGYIFSQRAKAHGIRNTQFVEYLEFPFSLQHEKQAC